MWRSPFVWVCILSLYWIIAYAGIVLCARCVHMWKYIYHPRDACCTHLSMTGCSLAFSWAAPSASGMGPCLTLFSREFTLDREHSHKFLRKGMENKSYTFPSVSLAFTDTLARYRMFSSEVCKYLLLRDPWLGSSLAISDMILQYSLCPCLTGRTAWHTSFSSWVGLLRWPFYFLIFHICVLPKSMYVHCVL